MTRDVYRTYDISPGMMRAQEDAWRGGGATPQAITFTPSPHAGCTHVTEIRPVVPSARGCEDCLRMGGRWVHLRICLTCGHVGCCDSSPNRHATAHHHATTHPIVRSLEPGETWAWCYPDEIVLEDQEVRRRG